MMQVLNVVFITIAILIIVYAVGDFVKNININNDIEVKNKLIKIKRRMIIAIFIFVFPFALSLVIGLFSSFSSLFVSNEFNEIEVDSTYLDSSYGWNDEGQYYESSDSDYVIETVNIKDDNLDSSFDVLIKENKKVKNDDIKAIIDDEIDEENKEEEHNIEVNNALDSSYNVVVKDKVIDNSEYINNNAKVDSDKRSLNNSFIYNNKNIIQENRIKVEEKLLNEEEIVEENMVVNYASNNTINNKMNEMIVNNQPKKEKVSEFNYYNQCDNQWQVRGFCSTGYSMCNNGCGASAIAMVASTLGTNKNVTPIDVRDYLCSSKLHINGGMAYTPFTNSSLLNYYGLVGNAFINYNDSSKYDDNKALAIKNEVDKGNGVILLIPGHYVVIGSNKSCTANQVYMYDPASRGDSGCYTMGELWVKTWNRYNRCYNKKKCGWRMAWSYMSK